VFLSREYRGKRIVIYPAYFDANLSRREGRRIPKHLAISNPRLEDIVEICRKLGLNPEVEADKVYPRNIFSKGRIIVDKRGSKIKTLFLIASELKKQYRQKATTAS